MKLLTCFCSSVIKSDVRAQISLNYTKMNTSNLTTSTMSDLHSKVEPYIEIGWQYWQHSIEQSERYFLQMTENINFPLFCVIYAFFILWLFSKLNKKSRWRPRNRQLVSTKQYYRQRITSWVMNLPVIRSYVRGKISKSMQEVDQQVGAEFEKDRDTRKALKLPPTGMSEENLKRRINEWYQKQVKIIDTGKVSGTIYQWDESYNEQMNNFAAIYMYQNPLHLDSFKELLRMESEVLKMTASLISKSPEKNCFGVCTSGGSESLIMCLEAYRKYYPQRKRPNIVVPNTIHAAVDKGCFYFNIEVRKAKLHPTTFQVDLEHMESLIDSNTICLMGSYPNYPHGIIDPIDRIAKLGLKYKVGVHIDGCLGGFVAGFVKEHEQMFSIDREGVTSVSLDHHKFGLAPKGISNIFFKTREHRHCMYFLNTEWCGGIYCTPSFTGSRSGFASAGAWFALTQNTKKGYKQNAKELIEATVEGAKKLRNVSGVQVFGDPKLCALAFTTTEVSCFDVNTFLTKNKHYNISPIHKPNAIHISVTLANCQTVRDRLAKDVEEAIASIKKNPPGESATAAIYGATANLPTAEVGDDLIKTILGASLK